MLIIYVCMLIYVCVFYLCLYVNYLCVYVFQNGEDERNTTAWQKFLPTGPVALLPVSHDLYCIFKR